MAGRLVLLTMVLVLVQACSSQSSRDHDSRGSGLDLTASDLTASDLTVKDAGTEELQLQDADTQSLDLLEEVQDPGPEPGAELLTYCRHDWKEGLEPITLGQLSGEVLGAYNMLESGNMEAMSFFPEHPFHVEKLRLQFLDGEGMIALRLMSSYGGSYPDIYEQGGDLMDPIYMDITADMADQWVEVDVSDQGLFLHPYRAYYLVYQHSGPTPYLAIENLPEGEVSRASMWFESSWYAVGDETSLANYRMELQGSSFCQWSEEERWFPYFQDNPETDQVRSSRATISDVDGDLDDDLILNEGGPRLFLNDGKGRFHEAENPWPAAWYMGTMVFGDLDNDGDQDVVGLSYVATDGDGDGYLGGQDGDDCNDASAAIHPGAEEVANSLDDDCDGIADDGLDQVDDDEDGYSEADGDCNDTRDDIYPGAPEKPDSADNDCNLIADDDLTNKILLNDGQGAFTPISCPPVELSDPSNCGALGDGDGDGILDLYYGNWLIHYPDPPAELDHYFRGLGDGCMEDVTDASGITAEVQQDGLPCYGVVWADYNNDGAPDIFVSNYGYGHNLLLENNGDGTFVDQGLQKGVSHNPNLEYQLYQDQGGNTFGADWGDFDNDGDLDLFATNIAHPRYQPWSDISQFLENLGGPDFLFQDIRADLGIRYDEGDVNASFIDFDNDGDLDLCISSLYPGHYATLYRNDGAEGFTDVSYQAGLLVHDAVSNVWADLDGDGDLDGIIADRDGSFQVHILENKAAGDNNWLELKLVGTGSNASAIGARVMLVAGGRKMIREIKGGGGHAGNQSSLFVHFGLGEATAIEELRIRWPGGAEEDFFGVEPNGFYLVTEGQEASLITR